MAGVWDLLDSDVGVGCAELGGDFGGDDRRISNDEQDRKFEFADEMAVTRIRGSEHIESVPVRSQSGIDLEFDDLGGTVRVAGSCFSEKLGPGTGKRITMLASYVTFPDLLLSFGVEERGT